VAGEFPSTGEGIFRFDFGRSMLPDQDGDGIPDIADNCPADANPDQSDRDLIGDLCDPFPDDRDNEKEQCFADLDAGVCVPVGGMVQQGRQQGGSRLSR
jgi:hypothetical protein